MVIYINQTDYSLISAYNFFGGSDKIRVIILIYILISFLLNTLNFTFVLITQYKKRKKKISLGILVTCTLLFVNFIHTFAYLFQWVIKKGDVQTVTVYDKKNNTCEVGGLLTGNPSNFFSCYFQAFLLVSSSISQDFIINIFFYMASRPKEELKKWLINVLLLIFGFIFPIGFTLLYYFLGSLGLNDEFCYVKKFYFDKYKENENYVQYFFYDKFQLYVMIVYGVRVLNSFITLYFLIKILIYVKKENKSKSYIFKTILIPIIQLFTIIIGVIYRILNIFSYEKSAKFSPIYLILNTIDGVLFPFIFLFQNNIFTNLKKYVSHDVLNIDSNNGAHNLVPDDEEDDDEDDD